MIRLSHPLIFIRHGQTDWNREGRLQGSQDIPINANGERQARRNGVRLAELMDEQDYTLSDFTFVASPLGRCLRTMGLVREGVGLDPEDGFLRDDRLKEITFGAWEGNTHGELRKIDAHAVSRRETDKWGFVPPRGESYAMLSDRIAPWLESLDRPTIAVSHGGVSRAVRGLLFDLPSDEVPMLDVPQDQLYLVADGQGFWL
ncbi:MAG: histidine phosphatase family protein [Hyphomicrobiales bacterium]